MPAFLKRLLASWKRCVVIGSEFIVILLLITTNSQLTTVHADWNLDLDTPASTISTDAGISASCTNCASGSTSIITITCSDTGGSGCLKIEYSESSSSGPWTIYTTSLSRTSNTTIYAKSTDNAGNIGPVTSQSITFAASFNFSLANSGNINLIQGQNGSNTITLTRTAGTAESITLSPTSGPAPSIIGYSTNPCTPNDVCSITLLITNTGSVTPGVYGIIVTGTATGGLIRNTSFNLTVSALPPPPNNSPSCTLINGPALLNPSVQGSYTVTASDSDGTITSTTYTPSGGSPSSPTVRTYNQPLLWSASSTGAYTMNAVVTDDDGGTANCPVKNINVTYPAWIQTTGGDVHSNTGINTPGGP